MRKTNVWIAVFAFSAMALIAVVSLPSKPRTVPEPPPKPQAAAPVARTGMARAHQALVDRYEWNLRRLDSAERDSGGVHVAERKMDRRLLREARTRRDHTQSALDLLGRTDTTDPAGWEIARAAAQDSLDSLERYLDLARIDTLKPQPPGPPPSHAAIKAAKQAAGRDTIGREYLNTLP